jgi:nucleotide-binding universal stress UspA family protein
MLPSRILVATDGSPSAKAAEAFAAETAAAEHASTVVVVTVLATAHPTGHVGPLGPTDPEIQEAQDLVSRAAERIKGLVGTDSIAIEPKVITSALSEAEGIIGEAHATGACSHIVMGNRGHGEFKEVIVGSTSHHVIREAHCPVTIIRP